MTSVDPNDPNRLPLSVAVPLAHALVAAIAERKGIRVLFIKGPLLTVQGLRAPRLSADVDVWVEPARVTDLVNALSALGWRRRAESRSWQLFITHSVTLVRDGWPCDIDVHDRFPGAFAAPDDVFEALWADREGVPLEVGPVLVPSRPYHAVIAMLHALREASPEKRADQLAPLLELLRQWPVEELDALRAAAERIGAAEVIAETVAPLGIRLEVPDRPSGDLLVWRLRNTDTHHSVDWMLELMTVPRGQRLGVLRQAIFPPREDVAADHPEKSGSRISRLGVRIARLGRAVRSLPQLVRAMRVARVGDARRAFEDDRNARAEDAAAIVESTPVAPAAESMPVVPPAAPPVTGDALLRRSETIAEVTRPEADYVLDLETLDRPPFVLSGTAALIWRAVTAEGGTTGAVTEEVAASAGMEPAAISDDVATFLLQLRGYGLVQAVESSGPANADSEYATVSEMSGA